MNNLLTESFERIVGRYPGEDNLGRRSSFSPGNDNGMEGFFRQVSEIEKDIESITTILRKLEAAHEESKHTTKVTTVKAIKLRMEKDVDEVRKIALRIKTSLEQLDRDNLLNRQKEGCEKGTGIDRSRVSMTVALKKKLKERMVEFQTLKQNIHDEYREVVERRVYTVTGTRPDQEMVEELIETGKSEQIFKKAIQDYGRGQIVDAVAEIQERHDTVLELEQKLLSLQQMFLDMAVLVDAQGDMINDIEAQVSKSVDHVQKATIKLQEAKKLQKSNRKYMCIIIIILIIVLVVVLLTILKMALNSA